MGAIMNIKLRPELVDLLQYQKEQFDLGKSMPANMSHWAHSLAKHFPKILVEKDGKAVAFEFLDQYYELEVENDLGRAEKEWEEWELSFLVARFKSNLKYQHLAKALGRTDNEIRRKVIELGFISGREEQQ